MLRAAIIGCGNIAWRWDHLRARTTNTHATAYARHRGVTLVACADPVVANARGLARRFPGVRSYADWRTMLREERPDVASVCAPTAVHGEMLAYLLRSTDVRVILAEKPLAATTDEVRAIARLVRHRRVTILVNYLRRWDATIDRLRKLLAAGSFGTFTFGTITYYGGVRGNAVHLLDLLSLLGFSLTVARSEVVPYGVDDVAGPFTLESRGRPISFHWFDHRQYGHLEVDLFFTRGRVRIGDYSEVEISRPRASPDFPGYRDLGDVTRWPSSIHQAMRGVVDAVVRGARTNRVDVMAIDRELRLARLSDAIAAVASRPV